MEPTGDGLGTRLTEPDITGGKIEALPLHAGSCSSNIRCSDLGVRRELYREYKSFTHIRLRIHGIRVTRFLVWA